MKSKFVTAQGIYYPSKRSHLGFDVHITRIKTGWLRDYYYVFPREGGWGCGWVPKSRVFQYREI